MVLHQVLQQNLAKSAEVLIGGAVGSGALGGAVLGGITGGIGGIAGEGLGAPENLGAETLINFDVSIWGGIGSEWSR